MASTRSPSRAEASPVSAARREGVGLGLIGVYGVSFGAVAIGSGFEIWQAMVLSLVGFTGGSQFAYVGVVASGGSPVAAAASAVLLGARNTLYGLRLSALLPRRPTGRAVAAHLVIDETTAMALRHETAGGAAARAAFWSSGLTLFVTWNVTTLLGAAGVRALGDPTAFGLDAAAPAAFLALVWPALRRRLGAAVALAAAAVALGLTLVAPAGVPVLAAAVVAFVGLHPRLDLSARPPVERSDGGPQEQR
jgi:predicted branched-subunit amino acid permease